MAQYWVKIERVYEDYIEADSEAEAVEIAQTAMFEEELGYWDSEVEKCEDDEEEEDDDE